MTGSLDSPNGSGKMHSKDADSLSVAVASLGCVEAAAWITSSLISWDVNVRCEGQSSL